MAKDFGVAKLDGDKTFEAGAPSCGSVVGTGNAGGGGSGQYGWGGDAAGAGATASVDATASDPNTHARYGSTDDQARRASEFCSRDHWADSPVNVQAWLEKDALAGVLVTTVVEEFELDRRVTRGYSNVGYPQSAADFIRAEGRPTYVCLLTAFTPPGSESGRSWPTGSCAAPTPSRSKASAPSLRPKPTGHGR